MNEGRMSPGLPGSMRPEKTDIAKGFFRAFSHGDRTYIEEHMASNFYFSSPADPLLDKDGYFLRCWPYAGQNWRFEFIRVIEEENTVVITYEQERPDGINRNTEVFTFSEDKVQRIEVYFGWIK